MYQTDKTSHQESRSVAACFLFLDGPASSLLAILKTFQLADCAGLLWMLRVDRFTAHVALASTKNRYYSIAWLRPSFFLSLYCSQWKRRSRDSLETDKMSGRFWVFVSGRFCDRTEEREKLRRAEDLPPKTEGLAPLQRQKQNKSYTLLSPLLQTVTGTDLSLQSLELLMKKKGGHFEEGLGVCPSSSENFESRD